MADEKEKKALTGWGVKVPASEFVKAFSILHKQDTKKKEETKR